MGTAALWEKAPDLAVSRSVEKPGGLSPRMSTLSPTRSCAPSATEMSLDMGNAAWAPRMPPMLVNRLACVGGTAQMEGVVRASDVESEMNEKALHLTCHSV